MRGSDSTDNVARQRAFWGWFLSTSATRAPASVRSLFPKFMLVVSVTAWIRYPAEIDGFTAWLLLDLWFLRLCRRSLSNHAHRLS